MILACLTREPGCCQCLEDAGDPATDCPDCIQGESITSNLINNQLVAESVGRAFLDEEHLNKRRVQGTCSLHEYMKPKSLVRITDRVHGTFQGKLSKFAINISVGLRGQISARSIVDVIKVHE